jgi:triphosphoribosyl-dephospho-CoA synthase
MDKTIDGTFICNEAFIIGETAILGMLYEVSTSPKPGMVTPDSRGTHGDMDYFTFLRSSASIASAMYKCAQIGLMIDVDILTKIRNIGISAEKEMLFATNGVNTQKGIIFLGGIVSSAAGSCLRKKIEVNRFNISLECNVITSGIVERELYNLKSKNTLTNGERIYLNHKITGIRGEIEKGLPSVLTVGLPLYEDALIRGLSINKALANTLIGLMTVVEDTVVINRSGLKGYEFMRAEAKKAMELGGMHTPEGQSYIEKLNMKFIERNISPGGAADLLAITVMIYELEKQNKFTAYGI